MRYLRIAAAAAITLAAIAGCASAPAAAPATVLVPHSAAIPAVPGSLDGVYEPGVPGSYAGITGFGAATGTAAKVAVYYSGWWEKFQENFAATAWSHGAYTLVQLQPTGSLENIVRGYDDSYLRSYAAAVKAFGHPVILSFGHEMNGTWYSWGEGRTAPAVFVAAWRHIVTVFRSAGATNATWLWTVNAVNAASSPMQLWWPGGSYVNWVGIDGYYYYPTDTFAGVFGRTLTEIRHFTRDPVLLSETGVGPSRATAAQIRGLFAGVKANRLLGLVWFDVDQSDPPYHQDWRLEDDPAALAAFRAAVKEYG